jgi:hypothetical protein
MCKGLVKMRMIYLISAIVVLLSMTGRVLAIDHWWVGGVSNNLNDPANWTDRDAATPPTTPTGPSRTDIVRIGASWGSEDLNGNGVLDPGEDLNGNGIIDNPDPNSGVGYGGYYGDGGGIDLLVDPVLRDTYVSRSGLSSIGWLFVLNAPNILTLEDGAFLIFSRQDSNIRNGGRIEVQGRSSTGGPSLVMAKQFRIAENGSIVEAAHETSQLRINGTGWVQVDPEIAGGGVGIYIGQEPELLATTPRGEIIIEDQGRLELMSADPQLYIDFGRGDPSVNQIIIRDEGELWLSGDMATIGRVGDNDTETSLQELIAMGLITGDEGSILTISGTNPTVVKVGKRRVANPIPADGDSDVERQVALGWDSSQLADKYDIYLGTDLDAVSNANRDNPMDVLKSQGQFGAYYPLAGTLALEFGQTYYWRVDEVNNLSDPPIYKGKIWSFTVEPFARSISADDIIATASSQAQGQGPENTINGSGLVADLHSTVLTDMWLSQASDPGSAWIQYEFDKVYMLNEMLVWNYNGQSLLSASSLKDVVVEYSTDGVNWTPIDSVSEFERAPGMDNYAHNTTVAFDGISAKYVKITANSNWSGGFVNQYGLSEVRFMYIPVSARMPYPNDEAGEIAIDVTLGWRAGRQAAEHSLYMSKDQQVVIDGTVSAVTVNQPNYGPLSLDLGSTYYWRVDEVNNADAVPVWEGNTWSFTTQQYLVVDDFESYNDISEGEPGSNLVYKTWIDGYDNPSVNGSTMGYFEAFQPSMEKTIVHAGGQSAPVMYDNSTASISEVTANPGDLAIGSDWTVGAPERLSLWFYGNLNNSSTERMYVKINGAKVTYDGSIAMAQWHEFSVDLASLGIDLSNVTTLTIGFERTGATGGSGKVLIDDIRLYAPQE